MSALVSWSAKVTEMVGRRRVDVVVLQKVRYTNESVKASIGGDFKYKLYWKGEDTANGGVGLMAECELAKSVMDVNR